MLPPKVAADADHINARHCPMRTGTAISVLAHVAIVTAWLVLAGVHPFDPTVAEAVTVDIVTPDEVPPLPKEPDKKPEPPQPPDLSALDKPVPPAPSSPTAAEPPPPSSPQPQSRQTAALAPTPAQPSPPPPAEVPVAQPDITEQYGTMFSLPDPRSSEGFDAAASAAADIKREDVAALRAHLRTCSILPASVSPSDKVKVTLRVALRPDGRLAAEPMLIEASASKSGPLLMRSAMEALEKCQPYTMLPADRYKEWKVLDLRFTPRDFKSG
jgi:outer membrane biosynthesis protein TonB